MTHTIDPFDSGLQRALLNYTDPTPRSTVTALAVRKGDHDFLNFLNSWLTVQRDGSWLDERIAFWSGPSNWLE